MKIDRLLGILTTLLNTKKITAKELAEKFEVSVRTIQRDIDSICSAGIPLVTYPGGNGGICLAEGYALDKNLLNTEELNNIIVGLKGVESISAGNSISLLQEKLLGKQASMLPGSNSIFIDLSSFYKTSLSNKIELLRSAISNQNLVAFDYYSPKGLSRRTIEPYYITFKWNNWYVFGYCTLREDFRLFKLTRTDGLTSLTQDFTQREIPSNDTLEEDFFSTPAEVITLILSPTLEYAIIDDYGVNSYEKLENGNLKFQFDYNNLDFALTKILGFGDKAEVISPSHIREKLKVISQNIYNLYK